MKSLFASVACAGWLAFLIWAGGSAADVLPVTPATPAVPVASLTLDQAIAAALKNHPDLAPFVDRLRTHEARVEQGALRPAPEVSVEVENVLGTGEFKNAKAAETTFALSQVVELGGKRDARLAAAKAGRSVVEADREVQMLDVVADVTRRFVLVAGRQERLKLAHTATQLAETTVSSAERRVKAARSPHAELDRARLTLDRLRLEQQRAEIDLDAARGQLAATWGESGPTLENRPLGEIRADLFAMPAVMDLATLHAKVAGNVDFLRFASEARLRDAELRLASIVRKPDVTLGMGARRLESSNDQALVASFSLPLFSGRRAQGLIKEAQAQRDLVDAERRGAEVRAKSTLYELHLQLRQAVREADTVRRDMLPRMQEALRETQYAYERGRYSYLELVEAQREFLSLQSALITASVDAHTLRAEIERLTREPLDATPTKTE